MKHRRTLRWALVGCAGLLALPCGLFGFYASLEGGSSRGSPALAAEWRDRLSQYLDPEAARAGDPEVVVLGFTNGEWVFGRSQSSHGMWHRGGGTVVVRDSRGRTRAFFGHVCGWGQLGVASSEFSQLPSLAEFYKRMAEEGGGFAEHALQ